MSCGYTAEQRDSRSRASALSADPVREEAHRRGAEDEGRHLDGDQGDHDAAESLVDGRHGEGIVVEVSAQRSADDACQRITFCDYFVCWEGSNYATLKGDGDTSGTSSGAPLPKWQCTSATTSARMRMRGVGQDRRPRASLSCSHGTCRMQTGIQRHEVV